jgi:hypothetical protein
MVKYKTVKVRQELVKEIEKRIDKNQFQNLSDFVSTAIQFRLRTLDKKRIPILGEDIIGIRTETCYVNKPHKIKIFKYNDSSMWIACPNFGWFKKDGEEHLGCRERKKRCTWFFG